MTAKALAILLEQLQCAKAWTHRFESLQHIGKESLRLITGYMKAKTGLIG